MVLASGHLASLVITQQTLSYTISITCSLQAESRDIMDAVDDINTFRVGPQSVRDNVDDTGLETWRRCAERLELSHPYRCNAASSAFTPTHQPKQHVNTTSASSPSPYLTMFSVSLTHQVRLSRDCVLCQQLLAPSLKMKPRKS